jgi:hypothetical protein
MAVLGKTFQNRKERVSEEVNEMPAEVLSLF